MLRRVNAPATRAVEVFFQFGLIFGKTLRRERFWIIFTQVEIKRKNPIYGSERRGETSPEKRRNNNGEEGEEGEEGARGVTKVKNGRRARPKQKHVVKAQETKLE